jgi:hypothetical protein
MYDALIYSLEYLKTLPNFPHEGDGKRGKIPDNIRQEIIKEIRK